MPLRLFAFTMLALSAFAPDASALKFQPAVPADLQAQVSEDLSALRLIRGRAQSPMHAALFNSYSGYNAWFEKRIQEFGNDANPKATSVAWFDDSGVMMVTPNFVHGNFPQAARWLTLFHEARHAEDPHGAWEHVECPTPFRRADGSDVTSIFTGRPMAGSGSCDEAPLGAYGITVVMMSNISKHCESCTEKVKLDAELYAKDQLDRVLLEKSKLDLITDSSLVQP